MEAKHWRQFAVTLFVLLLIVLPMMIWPQRRFGRVENAPGFERRSLPLPESIASISSESAAQTGSESETSVASNSAVEDFAPISTHTTVLHDAEGFARAAREAEASANPFERDMAETYWRAVIHYDSQNVEAWRGYARAIVGELLSEYDGNPYGTISSRDLDSMNEAVGGYLSVSYVDSLAYELAAYAAALQGDRNQALIYVTQAEVYGAEQGFTADDSMMSRVIIIANTRQSNRGW